MRNCVDEGALQTWFDGELTANEAANITAHLHECARCAESARTLETENLLLSEGLSAEFAGTIPSERLRQRVDAAISGLPVASVPGARESWLDAVRNLFPSFRVLAYASMAAAILLAGFLAMVYLRSNQATLPVTVENHPPQVVVPTPPTPEASPQQVVPPQVVNSPKALPPRRTRPLRNRGEMETTLASVERQYERAIVKLNEAIQTQAPMRPSLRVEYEYNMALIDSAIATTRDVARKNPGDPQATQFVLAAYQSKIDLMNQIAEARIPER